MTEAPRSATKPKRLGRVLGKRTVGLFGEGTGVVGGEFTDEFGGAFGVLSKGTVCPKFLTMRQPYRFPRRPLLFKHIFEAFGESHTLVNFAL